MIRYLILLFNMLGLLVYHLFLPDVITATQVVPSTVKPGDSFTVEITITKGTVSSFAKLQEDLPNGFTASEVDSKGGTFSFKDHSVKFIWTALPSDNSFVVKYKITVDPSVSGQQSFGGKFSYVVGNDRQSVEITASNINVASDNSHPVATTNTTAPDSSAATSSNTTASSTTPVAASTDNTTSQPSTTPQTTSDNSAANNNSTNNEVASTTSTPVVSSSGVSAFRIVPSGDIIGSFIVTVNIRRSNVSGFAKLEETLPIGFTATAIDKAGASFSFADQKAKFIWMSLPTDSVVKVSYKVSVDNSITGSQIINGVFAYVQGTTQKYPIAPSSVSILSGSSQPMANNTANTSNSNTTNASGANQTTTNNTSTTNTNTSSVPVVTNNTNTTTTNTTTSDNNATTSDNTQAVGNNNNSSAVTDATNVANVPSAKSGISYSVQIAALHKAVQKSYFVSTNHINESIRLEMMDGFTKYVVGNFKEYKSARDHREVIRGKGIVGPFVTAYNTGKRITVQEALMVSNQKWYK